MAKVCLREEERAKRWLIARVASFCLKKIDSVEIALFDCATIKRVSNNSDPSKVILMLSFQNAEVIHRLVRFPKPHWINWKA